ncbi:MAG TPA: hypothetical protein VJ385_04335 [Fibrobacteria bacterium]|nr:hypothetical protein [Fibrobacteria bacterium]
MRRAVSVPGLLSAAAGLWLFTACNVFTPIAADGEGDLTYRGLILKGNAAINDGEYASAVDYFAQAKAMNPRGSEAYLFHSKALVSLYGIDYNTLNDEFNDRRNKDGKGKKGIPFIDSATTLEKIDSTYFPVAQSVENLEHILRRQRDTVPIPGGWKLLPDGDTASDGKISEGVARLDLGLLQTIKGMLGPLDLDGDNHVDTACGDNLCPGLGAACMAGAAYKAKCKEGPRSEVTGFESFKQLTRSIDISDLNTKDVRARQLSSNPNDINSFLDKMQGPIASSSYNLDSVTDAMKSHNEIGLSGQLTEIVTNIADLSNFLSYMRFDDRLDNDFDDQDGSGKGERMIWHDYDKDGGIHFDYDEDATLFAGYLDTPANSGSRNIGHPMHRYLHPELYVKFADSAWTARKAAKDTSKNARKAAMVKHCQDVAGRMDVDGKVTAPLIAQIVAVTCSTTTSILKSTVRPPARSDWLSGTFGVDEEEIDDRDNDYDGLKDEDARNAAGMDDDDDALLLVSMVGTRPKPMVWSDAAGHDNGCPDIDIDVPMQAPPFQRQFCIGSLEHRIYLAQHGGTDTLRVYYSKFLGEGANQNCLEDFDKLPQAYKDRVGLHASTDDAVQDACLYKHIWVHGMPPRSEWTAGVLGLDEEIPDGVDNDGDGWIDEDVK